MQAGIEGCRIQTASRLACSGLGTQLIEAVQCHASLSAWQDSLCDELCKSSNKLQQDLADSIPADFPDIKVVNLYLNPAVTQHNINMSPISVNRLLLALLAVFTEDHFVWGDTFSILSKYSEALLPGLAVWQPLHSAAVIGLGLSGPNCPIIKQHIHSWRKHRVHPPEL
jgi:hypothetical protein